MLKYLLDTNIVIYTLKHRPQQVKSRFLRYHGRMGISAVTLGELVFEAEHSQQVERNLADIEAMVARLEVVPLTKRPHTILDRYGLRFIEWSAHWTLRYDASWSSQGVWPDIGDKQCQRIWAGARTGD